MPLFTSGASCSAKRFMPIGRFIGRQAGFIAHSSFPRSRAVPCNARLSDLSDGSDLSDKVCGKPGISRHPISSRSANLKLQT